MTRAESIEIKELAQILEPADLPRIHLFLAVPKNQSLSDASKIKAQAFDTTRKSIAEAGKFSDEI